MDAEQVESWDASYGGTQDVHRTAEGVELYYEHRSEGRSVAHNRIERVRGQHRLAKRREQVPTRARVRVALPETVAECLPT